MKDSILLNLKRDHILIIYNSFNNGIVIRRGISVSLKSIYDQWGYMPAQFWEWKQNKNLSL